MQETSFITPPAALPFIESRTAELNFNMASEPRTGSLLQVLAASKPKGRLLELGTGTGLATAWLLSGMDAHSDLISVDTDPSVQAVAREALGADPRLTLVLEDAATWLSRQTPVSFDLIFADAMPGKYESRDAALALVAPAGFYVIDDMLPQPNWPDGHDIKASNLLDSLSLHPGFHMASMAWSTGIVVLVRK
ncbi:MAG: class I SAM-dependent methyltransferase [Terracidiphilus sp.]|jgi:predicted O-methyltransferase YrrM